MLRPNSHDMPVVSIRRMGGTRDATIRSITSSASPVQRSEVVTVQLRREISRVIASAIAGLFCLNLWSANAMAQPVADPARSMVEIPVAQLNEIQQELRYLRTRDAERQVWEDSIMNRLPSTDFNFASHRLASGNDCDSAPQACDALPTACRAHTSGICCCECDPCACPLPEAPCIDCPHVSTLSPYFNINIFGASSWTCCSTQHDRFRRGFHSSWAQIRL